MQNNLFADTLTTAYCEVEPKKIAKQIRPDYNELE